MLDFTVRQAKDRDLPYLKKIWKVCFGDSDDLIDRFFDVLYPTGGGCVADLDGQPVSAVYYLTSHTLAVPQKGMIPCAYIYSLGTLPEYRSLGLGERVILGCVDLAKKAGFDTCVLCPAEKSLFPYYGKMGFTDAFSVCELELSLDFLPFLADYSWKEESSAGYIEIRRRLLRSKIYMDISPEAFDYLAPFCKFLSFNIAGEEGCAAVELQEGAALVKELIFSDIKLAVSCLDGIFKAKRYIVRTPGSGRPLAMIYPPNSLSGEAYFGLALD